MTKERANSKTLLRKRNKHGGVLALVLAVLLLLMALTFFGLQFTRFLGSEQEQRTAIEAGALAAAQDLSRLIVDDPYFGFVSLSDNPPNGPGTAAGDGFPLPVQSINTILATNRLDNIIADWLNQPILQQYASRDYQLALAAEIRLITALKGAIQPGGSGSDVNGNTVKPYDDAVAAYQKNIIRMTGGKASLVPNSLQLTLGYETGLTTNIQIPQPEGISHVSSDQEQNDDYKAFIDVPYGNSSATKDYVFGAAANDTVLVDFRKFKPSLSGLPYEIPTIVKCEADEQITTTNATNGIVQNSVIHAVACAMPGCLIDQRPHPGALTIDFPNGMPPEITHPGDLLANTQITQTPADRLQTPPNSDWPPDTMQPKQLPYLAGQNNPLMGSVLWVGLYDWIRRSGPRVRVDLLVQALNSNFDNSIAATSPQSHTYEVAPNGSITYTVVPLDPKITDCASNKQWFAVSGLAFHSSNALSYDIFAKDFCFQPGKQQGGQHAGEPLPSVNNPITPAASPIPIDPLAQDYLSKRGFPAGDPNTIRPSYNQLSTAFDIELRQR